LHDKLAVSGRDLLKQSFSDKYKGFMQKGIISCQIGLNTLKTARYKDLSRYERKYPGLYWQPDFIITQKAIICLNPHSPSFIP